ncbi:MAG: hypothetical protein LH603_10165 [Pseudonocardia sp.]|nr:hypothetical protein [Pseudonocardia sp.]
MLKFLLGAAVGYVLGTRAGHERYEQLKRTYERVAASPAVQNAAGTVRARVEERVRSVRGSAGTADTAGNGHAH